jgi:choline transport protein
MSSGNTSYKDVKNEDHITVYTEPTSNTARYDEMGQASQARTGHGNSSKDDDDMRRLGKTQELNRNFHWFHTLAFTTVIMATWEIILIVNNQGLTDGGRPGFLYSYIWSCLGFAPIVLSLAEMSSMSVFHLVGL